MIWWRKRQNSSIRDTVRELYTKVLFYHTKIVTNLNKTPFLVGLLRDCHRRCHLFILAEMAKARDKQPKPWSRVRISLATTISVAQLDEIFFRLREPFLLPFGFVSFDILPSTKWQACWFLGSPRRYFGSDGKARDKQHKGREFESHCGQGIERS